MTEDSNEREALTPSCTDGFNRHSAALRFDPEAYARYLAEFDLTEAQQLQLMRAVWDLMVLVVDAGFGVDAVTLAQSPEERAADANPATKLKSRQQAPEEVSP